MKILCKLPFDDNGNFVEYDLSNFLVKIPYREEVSLDNFILGLMEEIESTRDLVRSLEDKLESTERELKSEIAYVERQIK